MTLHLGRALSALLAAVFCVAAMATAPALAQTNIQPPEALETTDQFGVELSSGFVQVSSPTISIGPPSGGLSYAATWDTSAQAWRSSTWGGINKAAIKSDPYCYAFITVTAMGQTGTFQQDTCTGGYELVDGLGTLSRSGNIWTYTGPDGSVALYDYAQRTGLGAKFSANQGMITSITRPNGEVISFNWVGFGNPRSVTNNLGYQLHFDYDSGVLSKVTALNNAVDPCAPSSDTCSIPSVWPSLTFTTVGSERRVTDALGNITRLIFDTEARPNLVGVARPEKSTGSNLTFTVAMVPFLPIKRVASVSDGVGTWNYEYEPRDCEVVPDRDANVCPPPPWDYTLKTTTTAPGNAKTIYHFTYVHLLFSLGEVTKSLELVTDALGQSWSPYIDGGGLYSWFYPEGNSVALNRDDLTGAPTGVILTAKPGSTTPNASTSITYPACTGSNPIACRRQSSSTDWRGKVTDYTYDAAGNLETTTSPAPTTGAIRPQTRNKWEQRYAWYKQNGSAAITQASSPVWVLVTTSTCATTTTCLGTADEMKTTTGYQVGSSSVASNLLPISQGAGSGNSSGTGALWATTTMTYTKMGDVETVDGPLSGTSDTTRYFHDDIRQVTGVVTADPDGTGPLLYRATRTTYRKDGLPKVTERGTTTSQSSTAMSSFQMLERQETTYNDQGRPTLLLKVRTDGVAPRAYQTSYDAKGRTTCSTVRMNMAIFTALPTSACTLGASGIYGPDRITYTVYDALDRVSEVYSGYGTPSVRRDAKYYYFPNGTQQYVVDGNGNTTQYANDGLDRRTTTYFSVQAVGTGGVNGADYEQVTYDLAGNVTQRRKRDGQVYNFDIDDLNRSKNGIRGEAFTYDNLGRPSAIAYGGLTSGFKFDALGRMTQESLYVWTTKYQYDLAGNRTRITWPDGFYATYDYDNAGAVKFIKENGSTTLATYGYDDLGHRVSLARADGVNTTYAYNAMGNLGVLNHVFPQSANNVQITLNTHAGEQIFRRTTTNSAYEWTGLQQSRSYGVNGLNQMTNAGSQALTYYPRGSLATAGTTSYYYDEAENLAAALTGSTPFNQAFDPSGRLWLQNANGLQTVLINSGQTLIAEHNDTGTILRRYVPGPGVDEPLVWYEYGSSTSRRFLIQDNQGSVIAVTDGAGGTLAKNTYDEYGVPAAGNLGRYQYTGQTWIPEIGVYHYKARAYSPTLGRFLQTDPIGYDDGLNWYAYTHNDPLNNTDPTGNDSLQLGINIQLGPFRFGAGSYRVGGGKLAIFNPSSSTGRYRSVGGGLGLALGIEVQAQYCKRCDSISDLKGRSGSLQADLGVGGGLGETSQKMVPDGFGGVMPLGGSGKTVVSGSLGASVGLVPIGQDYTWLNPYSGEGAQQSATPSGPAASSRSTTPPPPPPPPPSCLRAPDQGGCSAK